MEQLFENARKAAAALLSLTAEKINDTLLSLAANIEAATPQLLEANAADMARMDADNPKRDRLQLTPARIADIAAGVRAVAELPSPIGQAIKQWTA